MLVKLMKYDLKDILKKIVPMYGFMVATGLIYVIFKALSDILEIFGLLATFPAVITTLLGIAILFGAFALGIRRFYLNLLKDQGYLTNTLPIDKKTLILSKLFSGIIIQILSYFVVFLITYFTFFLAQGLPDFSAIFKVLNINSSFTIIILISLLVSNFYYYALIFLSLALGHTHASSKVGYSIMYGVIITMALQIIGGIIGFISATLNPDAFSARSTIDDLNVTTLLTTIINLITTIILLYFTARTLKNKSNLD